MTVICKIASNLQTSKCLPLETEAARCCFLPWHISFRNPKTHNIRIKISLIELLSCFYQNMASSSGKLRRLFCDASDLPIAVGSFDCANCTVSDRLGQECNVRACKRHFNHWKTLKKLFIPSPRMLHPSCTWRTPAQHTRTHPNILGAFLRNSIWEHCTHYLIILFSHSMLLRIMFLMVHDE